MKLAFHGGAGTVTGSRFLLETEKQRVLIDCGLFQGLKELRLRNWDSTPFDPRSIDCVFLTHAHLDHSGYLPRLAKAGFRGPIYATPATAQLADILLRDAAKIQEEDAEAANRGRYTKHDPALPLFDEHDAERTLSQFRSQPFGKPLHVGDIRVVFRRAGHILGSAFIELTVGEGPEATTMVFSGDLGRVGAPLHRDPEPLPACDTLVLESTYGDREHSKAPLDEQLLSAIEPALRRGGIVLIPAFAVARAQLVTLLLNQLISSRRLRPVPIDVDSPMAVDATEIYRDHIGGEELDDMGNFGLLPKGSRLHRSVKESAALARASGPRIIISASGMLTGGRVLRHIERLGADSENLILLIGYQAEGTRGRVLAEGGRSIRVHGRTVDIRAQVLTLDGFSAHADVRGLVRWALKGEEQPRTIFVVHGEHGAANALADQLRSASVTAIVPAQGHRFEWIPESRAWRQLPSVE